jgi:excisionase family DNA binding protein
VITDDIRSGEAGQEPPATFLTPKDVQERLKIGERLTYKLLHSQAIPNVRVGNLYRPPRRSGQGAIKRSRLGSQQMKREPLALVGTGTPKHSPRSAHAIIPR